MRIVHTESSLGWGGQEIRILSESQGLARRGHEVSLLCPREARIFDEAPRWGLQPTALPIGRKSLRGFSVLRDWLKKNPCDVISTHSSTDSWLSALALASLGGPVPMVRTRHISAPVSKNFASLTMQRMASFKKGGPLLFEVVQLIFGLLLERFDHLGIAEPATAVRSCYRSQRCPDIKADVQEG